ncbi:uncharacterized protein LOC120661942 [Panicum virgatum]|uniref:Uncharacterized protein n=1 Tax=Panicum virgatum TaxID=38727 RepID=A0A8T0VU68_PANVG|nr:uncharacterized protein LOC120661942 [Panicum virgatum]KAG2638578.1 hypothetical protein PVAP13_2NG603700 [Panicum virgatum]
MGRGRNRKPRNFATFRLCPRPGAADASDRVFVRVDDNPYSVPGFTDDGGGPSSSSAVGGDDEPSSSSAEDGGDALPDHVRREILELGLPDDGYDYLAHLRELRPSLSSTGGGGSSAVFLPSRRRRPARSGLPVDVKAYDLSRPPLGSGEVAVATRRVEEAIDPDVAKLLDGSDLPGVESVDEDLEEDFVILANQSDEEQQIEEEEKNISGGKEKAQHPHHEQFDSLALEESAGGEDAVKNCATTVSRSYLSIHPGKILVPENAKKKLPKFSTGETSMKKAIIKKGIENLLVEHLPQRKTWSDETLNQGPYKEPKEEAKES